MNLTANPNPGNFGTIEATFTFPEFSNLIEKSFIEMLPQLPIDAKPLYIYKSIPQGQGDSIQMNEVDFTTFGRNMPEGVNAQKGKMGVGYHKQILWHRYGLEYDVTYKMRTTAQWLDVVQETVAALTTAIPQRINLDLTHQITFGNAVSYVDMDGMIRNIATGDGLSLFNAAHTLAFSPDTYSNIVPGNPQFSKQALEAAELLTKSEILNNFGELRRMEFDTIWCADTPNLMNDIMQLIRSVADPVQANSGAENPYRRKYEILPLSMLATDANGLYDSTKSLWWGIAALRGVGGNRWQAYHVEWEAPRMLPSPTPGSNGEDRHNDNWSMGARAACNVGAVVGKGIIASLAS